MGENADENREMGVGFGDLEDQLRRREYPATLEELLADHGDETLELHGDDVALRELLEPLRESGGETTYGDADEVHQEVLNMVSDEAVGRQGYSDRGGTLPEETDESETVQENDEDQSF